MLSTILLLGLLRSLWSQLADPGATQEGLARRNVELDTARRRLQKLADGIYGVVWEMTWPDFHLTYVSGNAAVITCYGVEQWIDDPHFWRDKLGTGPAGKQLEPTFRPDHGMKACSADTIAHTKR